MNNEQLINDRQNHKLHAQPEANKISPIVNNHQIEPLKAQQQQQRDDQKVNQQRNQENQAKLQRNFIDGGNFEFVSIILIF